MLSLKQFGEQIKTKYPQYASIDSQELAQKMLVKYPEYKNLVNSDLPKETTDTFLAGHPVLKSITNFANLTGLARGLSQTIFLKFTKEGKDLLKQAEQGKISYQEIENIIGRPGTGKEAGASVIGAGLNLGLAGGLGSTITAGGAIGKGLINAGLGAGLSASQAIQEGKTGAEAFDAATTGGAIAGGLSLAGSAVGVGLKALTDKLPKRLIQSFVKQPKGEILAGKDISQFVLDKKKIGTGEQILKSSKDAINSLSTKIEDKLLSSPASINKKSILDVVRDGLNRSGADITSNNELETVIGKVAPQVKGLFKKTELTLSEANKLRRGLDNVLGDTAFLGNEIPFNKEIVKNLSNTLRETIKDKASGGVRDLFSELSKEITLRDALENTLAGQSRNQILSLGNILGVIAGGAFGGNTVGERIAGAAIGIGANKALQSPFVLSSTAQGLNALKGLEPILKKLAPAEKTLLLNTISSLSQNASSPDVPQ